MEETVPPLDILCLVIVNLIFQPLYSCVLCLVIVNLNISYSCQQSSIHFGLDWLYSAKMSCNSILLS